MKILKLLAIAFLLFFAPSLYAQDGTAVPEQTSEEILDRDDVFAAPVVVDGETPFFVRGFSALSSLI